MTDKQKPKKQVKKPVDPGQGFVTKEFAAGLLALANQKSRPHFYMMDYSRVSPKHIREVYEEKNKRKSWRPWELLKIWAPKRDKEGKIVRPMPEDTRQQRRARQRNEAYAYMKEKAGLEPRRIRRAMARDRMRIFLSMAADQ